MEGRTNYDGTICAVVCAGNLVRLGSSGDKDDDVRTKMKSVLIMTQGLDLASSARPGSSFKG